MLAPLYTTLDDALDEIAPYGPALKNGNSNHAPMVAETLCALGRPQSVMPWIARYRQRMSPRPQPGDRVSDDNWRAALGRRERFADWSAFFGEKLREAPWREVLDRWAFRLAPGFCAAATHGVIRLGHAARGLAERDTASRRRELADALAGWAASWQELPAHGGKASGAMPRRQAISRVPVMPPDQRRSGNIVAALAALDDFREFAPVIGMIDTAGPLEPQIAEQTELFARVYLANAHDVPTTIAFVHAVTSHAALGNLARHVSDATARSALRYAWQTGCALYACYGSGAAVAEDVERCVDEPGALAERAVANGDEHVIKFTEACLSRHTLDPAPTYLAAAARATRTIPPRLHEGGHSR